jgi:hypothetical protein
MRILASCVELETDHAPLQDAERDKRESTVNRCNELYDLLSHSDVPVTASNFGGSWTSGYACWAIPLSFGVAPGGSVTRTVPPTTIAQRPRSADECRDLNQPLFAPPKFASCPALLASCGVAVVRGGLPRQPPGPRDRQRARSPAPERRRPDPARPAPSLRTPLDGSSRWDSPPVRRRSRLGCSGTPPVYTRFTSPRRA